MRWIVHLGLSGNLVLLIAKQLVCPAFKTLWEASLPLSPFGKLILFVEAREREVLVSFWCCWPGWWLGGVLSGSSQMEDAVEGACFSEAIYHGTSPGRESEKQMVMKQANAPQGQSLSGRLWRDRSYWQQRAKGKGPQWGTFIWRIKDESQRGPEERTKWQEIISSPRDQERVHAPSLTDKRTSDLIV